MNYSNGSRADEWLQYYEQQVQEMGTSVNAVNVTSSSESFPGGHVAAAAETVGRRSRASRRPKPTTLLNANPSNFRALVQQFTGRSSAGTNSLRQKGPVTLDFGSPSSVSEDDIFPRSGGGGHERNYDYTLRGAWPRREENGTVGDGTTPYQMGQESGMMFHGSCDDDHHDGVTREYYGNNGYGYGMEPIYVDCDDVPHDDLCDTMMLEEFMMGDLDDMLD